jgi:mono/diheme cytochrome c family protein
MKNWIKNIYNWPYIFFGTLLFVSLITLCAYSDEPNGRKLFENSCVVCHGDKGMGDGPAASGLNPRPRNLVSDPFKNGDSAEAIASTLRLGLNQMPSFAQLSDVERLILARYILSLRSK